MSKKIIALLILGLFMGIFFYSTCLFNAFELDENKILNETRKAYENAQFEKEAFLKKKAFQNLAEFLLRHVDEIKNYNRHEEYRQIQLTEGGGTSYTNYGDCFVMPSFHPIFIKEYIPAQLTDSLLYCLDKLSDASIARLTLCSKGSNENIDPTMGSVSFVIKHAETHDINPNYYINHNITQNIKFRKHTTLNSIYDFGLTKDTMFLDDLRYSISITPYDGF